MAILSAGALLKTRLTASLRQTGPKGWHVVRLAGPSNRNCQELKIDVTCCKQKTVVCSNRGSQRRKAKAETETGANYETAAQTRSFYKEIKKPGRDSIAFALRKKLY